MQGFSDSKSGIKKLGELLQESGFVSEYDLQRAVEISRKNFQSLGKVLVAQKICREADVNNALEIQRLCKLEGLTGTVAVRILSLMKTQSLTMPEALNAVGWSAPGYNAFQEPEDVVAAKRALKEAHKAAGAPTGLDYAKALEAVGDAYLSNKLAARAECKYEEAHVIYESLPSATSELSQLLTKIGSLAIQQKRHDDAKAILAKAQTHLESSGLKESKEYARVLHVSAEYHTSRRKFSEAEKHYVECFNMLESTCGLMDEQVLDTVRRYVEAMNKATREPQQLMLGELLKGAGIVSEEQLTTAWQLSRKEKVALGRAIVDLGFISDKHLQLILQTQLLVRNNEISAQLALWIVRYACKLNKGLDEVLNLFNCVPKSRSVMAEELKAAVDQMSELESRLPPNHTELAFAHAKVAKIFFQRQQWSEAETHYKRALEIVSANPNLNPEKAIEVVDNYGELKIAQNDYDETVKVMKVSVQLRSKQYGQVSVPYAKGVERLAEVFCKKSDHSTAISCYERALAVREKLYGNEDRELIACLEAKADCHEHMKDLNTAEEVYDRAFAIADSVLGRSHEITERVLKKLVLVCKALEKHDKVSELAPGSMRDELFI